MDMVWGLLGSLLRVLALQSVFYLIGNVLLKLLTLGRYPRVRHLRQNARQGFPEFELVALFGLLSVVGLAVLVAWLATVATVATVAT